MNMLLTLVFIGGLMCGDCDQNGRVTVSEIVKAVNNLLNDDCGMGCDATGECPDACTEYPGTEINGVNYVCNTSLCSFSTAQVDSCVRRLVEMTALCYRVP